MEKEIQPAPKRRERNKMKDLDLDTIQFKDNPRDGGFSIRIKIPNEINFRICRVSPYGEKAIFMWLQEKIAREGMELAFKIDP
jgi:hypothetical protein